MVGCRRNLRLCQSLPAANGGHSNQTTISRGQLQRAAVLRATRPGRLMTQIGATNLGVAMASNRQWSHRHCHHRPTPAASDARYRSASRSAPQRCGSGYTAAPEQRVLPKVICPAPSGPAADRWRVGQQGNRFWRPQPPGSRGRPRPHPSTSSPMFLRSSATVPDGLMETWPTWPASGTIVPGTRGSWGLSQARRSVVRFAQARSAARLIRRILTDGSGVAASP